MKYNKIVQATFLSRPNRFEAYVDIDGKKELVHVKNTGRCREILLPGAKVILEDVNKPERKTRYDLIAAYKIDFGIINIDSQAPNKVAKEWLLRQDYDFVKPEYVYGNSRIDFYMERGNDKFLMEVKGCTLENNGVGYFPDAPTDRGVKHLRELTGSIEKGYKPIIAFVVGMNGISKVLPNGEIHPEFEEAFKEAEAAGVKVIVIECRVEEDLFEAL